MGRRRTGRLRAVFLPIAFLASTAAGLTGCILLELAKVRETEAVDVQYAHIAGTVEYRDPGEVDASHPKGAAWLVVYVVTLP